MRELIDKLDVLAAISTMKCGNPEFNFMLDKLRKIIISMPVIVKEE